MSIPRTAGADVLISAAASALATKRLTTVVVDDEIARDVRERVWDTYPPETSKIGYVLTCRKCTSVWAGLAVTLLSRNRWGRILVGALALSEASLLLDVALKGQNDRLSPDNDPSGTFFS